MDGSVCVCTCAFIGMYAMTCKFHIGMVLYIEGTTNEWMFYWFCTVMSMYLCVWGGRGRGGEGGWEDADVDGITGHVLHCSIGAFHPHTRFGRCISSQSVILANKNEIRGGS